MKEKDALWMIDGLLMVVVFWWNYGAHWTPWRVFPSLVNENGVLHRPVAYVHGLLTILLAFGAAMLARWALGMSEECIWRTLLMLAGVTVAAGAGTMLPRALRWIDEHQALEGDVEDFGRAITGEGG